MMMMMMMLWWLHSNLQGRDWLIAKWATQLKEFAMIVMIKMVVVMLKIAILIIIITIITIVIIIITIDNRVDHRIKALFNFFKRRSPIEDLAHIQESFLISISFEQELSRTNVWGKFDISSFWHTFNNSPFQSQLNRNCHADHQWISLLTYRKGLWSCPWTKGLTWFCLESWERSSYSARRSILLGTRLTRVWTIPQRSMRAMLTVMITLSEDFSLLVLNLSGLSTTSVKLATSFIQIISLIWIV